MENRELIEKIGVPAILEQCAEECAELGKAALKLARKLRGENPTPLTKDDIIKNFNEELADVSNCLDILDTAGCIDNNAIINVMHEKRKRWSRRLREEVES